MTRPARWSPGRLAVALVVAMVAVAGCGSDDGKPTGPRLPPPLPSAATDAGVATAGAKPLGADCAASDECESKTCFAGDKASYCTLGCTSENAATVCAAAPFNGVCNRQGRCRRP